MNNKSWFSIQNSKSDATIRIFSEIGGFGVSAEAFANELANITAKTIHLRINSPGGDAFASFAIFNSLRNHKARIISHIDGLAASAATIIMLAADEIRIAANGFLMIHEASSGAYGTDEDLRKTADMLGKLNDTIAGMYGKKSGKKKEEMLALMDAETWFNADEALAAGMVDSIEDEPAGDASAMQAAIAKYQSAPVVLRRVAAMLGANSSTNNGQSDALAPDGASTPAANSQEKPMNVEQFHAFAAEHPEARATYIDQGKKAGFSDAIAAEKARFKALREACGDNLVLACDLFDANKDADDAKIAVAAIARAKAEAEASSKAQADALVKANAEIEKLKAEAGTQPGVSLAKLTVDASAKYDAIDGDARIEAEWADDYEGCVKKFKVFNAYLGFRKSQMAAPKPAAK